jgi:cyclopropane fatty-acyl-phospholipid synthase-like methyltransferase
MTDERIIGLYEDNAAAGDRQRGRDLFERPWLDRFLARLPEGGTVLDVGCGMGEPIAANLIERDAQVTGVDSSPSLVELCRERFPDQLWRVADMRALDVGRRFDGLIAWHSLSHLTPAAQRPMFRRFADHLKPGGLLMFTSGHAQGDSIGTWQGEPLYHGSLDPQEYRDLLEESGFAIVEHKLCDGDCDDATVWLAQMIPASGGALV